MYYRLLEFLRCSKCYGQLTKLKIVESESTGVVEGRFNECRTCYFKGSDFFPNAKPETKCEVCWTISIMDGILRCSTCGESFYIQNGVPRMVKLSPSVEEKPLKVIKEATKRSFGFEWQFYDRHGWDYGGNKAFDPNRLEIEKYNFFHKGMIEEKELSGKVVLDAGCGNGRYSFQARHLGAEVIGVDLSDAVDAAAKNLAYYPDVHIVQGDIFHLPFERKCIDRIFCIGVLMHTGDAERAFESLVLHLKPGGIINSHVYRRGNGIYKLVDKLLRKYTTKMDLNRLLKYSAIGASVAKIVHASRFLTFGKPILYQIMNCFVRLEAAEHNVFDWYSAPVASHHTYPEVFNWYGKNNLEIIGHRKQKKNFIVHLLASPAGGVTVKGRLKDYQCVAS